MTIPIIRRGRGNPPSPVKPGDEIVRLQSCPDCGGRGWFLINPFSVGGPNGAGGIENLTQCLTCLDAHAYWQLHGQLPPELSDIKEAPCA